MGSAAVARALLHLGRYESERLLSWSFQCTCPLCIELRYVQSLACATHRVWRVPPPSPPRSVVQSSRCITVCFHQLYSDGGEADPQGGWSTADKVRPHAVRA